MRVIDRNTILKQWGYPYLTTTGSKTAGYILSKYWEKDIMPQNVYEDTILMPFEHLNLPAPSGYDVYLQNIFGGYMKLPPEKERYVTHNYRAYAKR